MPPQAYPAWPLWQRMLFRFIAIYFCIYILSHFGIDLIDDALVQFTAKCIGLSKLSDVYNGSGDSLYRYVLVLSMVVVSLIGCILWSVADRRRSSYNEVFYWFLVFVRYSLALYMIGYGYAKLFDQQFIPPSIHDLIQSYGMSTPMGLAWRFMGYSAGYRWFIGISEILGGVLLIFRRTTLLGAVLSIVVLSNVFAINMFYDVPVKLFSLHLLLMAMLVAAPDVARLWQFFVAHAPVTVRSNTPIIWINRSVVIRDWIKVGLIVVVIIFVAFFNAPRRAKHITSKVDGLYDVVEYVKNKDTTCSRVLDKHRWFKVGIRHDAMFIKTINDSLGYYKMTIDKTMDDILLNQEDSTVMVLHYEQPDTNTLVLNGRAFQDSVYAVLKKKNIQQYPLMSHGFRWVNEYPDNR